MFDRKVLLDNTSKVRSQLDRTQYPETYAALSDIYISEDTLFEIASRLVESRGFTVDNRDRQEILESRFPLTVNMAKKTYSAMGNVTCAAAAVSSGHLMTVDEFYAKYLG